MKITARVKPNSKTRSIEKVADNEFIIRVKADPKEGRANGEVIEVLSEYFGKPKSAIKILAGHKSKSKIVGIS